jgi:hypothetical protein
VLRIPFLNKKPVSTDLVVTKKNADINIFTVASGLLYEVRLRPFVIEIDLTTLFPLSAWHSSWSSQSCDTRTVPSSSGSSRTSSPRPSRPSFLIWLEVSPPSFSSWTLLIGLDTEYNFDYELVTYKWPHWLRAQKEKQRTIWGYVVGLLPPRPMTDLSDPL